MAAVAASIAGGGRGLAGFGQLGDFAGGGVGELGEMVRAVDAGLDGGGLNKGGVTVASGAGSGHVGFLLAVLFPAIATQDPVRIVKMWTSSC